MARPYAALLLIALSALTHTACGEEGPYTAAEPSVSLLFTESADLGSLEPTACHCRGLRVLRLRGVPAQVVWFEDHPTRQAGQLPARTFARQWTAFGFG